MELPEIKFKNKDIEFNHDSFVKSLKLPPFDQSEINDQIPFEEILPGQYDENARMNSFKTNKARLPLWLKAFTQRYWETLGKRVDFVVQWDDRRAKSKPKDNSYDQEIIITLQNKEKSKPTKLFVITTFLTNGTITIQGNKFSLFGEHEFQALKSFVDMCQEKIEVEKIPFESQELDNHSLNEETFPKQVENLSTETSPKQVENVNNEESQLSHSEHK